MFWNQPDLSWPDFCLHGQAPEAPHFHICKVGRGGYSEHKRRVQLLKFLAPLPALKRHLEYQSHLR